jgi:predicted dehydrogenase
LGRLSAKFSATGGQLSTSEVIMSILSALGLKNDDNSKKIRYAIVGLGDIAQEALLPGVAHTGNSIVTALVTSDPEKAAGVADRYDVEHTYRYEDYAELLRSGHIDAVYIATPNWRHAEFAVPALDAGIHVLLEKPIEVSLEATQAIRDAAGRSTAKLMLAYRLHFEPATLSMIDRLRGGEIGDVQIFNSVFTQIVSPDNHRSRHGVDAGPLLDMAPYPINAARYVFDAEPTEVLSAVGTRNTASGMGDFDHTVAVTLRFPGERLAQFVVSYVNNPLDTLSVSGSKGSIQMQPAYMYGKPLKYTLTVGSETSENTFKNTDHFGGELQYFSHCILNDQQPEPDGEEGYADMRVLDGIKQALASGGAYILPPFTRSRRIDTHAQETTLPAQKTPKLVNASSPSPDMDRTPKN